MVTMKMIMIMIEMSNYEEGDHSGDLVDDKHLALQGGDHGAKGSLCCFVLLRTKIIQFHCQHGHDQHGHCFNHHHLGHYKNPTFKRLTIIIPTVS